MFAVELTVHVGLAHTAPVPTKREKGYTMKKTALISAAVLAAGISGFAASASACGASARIEGMQLAQA